MATELQSAKRIIEMISIVQDQLAEIRRWAEQLAAQETAREATHDGPIVDPT